MKKVIRIVLLIAFYLGGIPLLALLTSFFSAEIVVGKDYSEVATVGEITFRGFPVWFIEAAPGISIMSSWHFSRFKINTGIWLVLLLLASISMHLIIKKKINRKTVIGLEDLSRN